MRILFITFSTTGNTQFFAEHLGSILESAGHDVHHYSALPLVKKLNISPRTPPSEEPETEIDSFPNKEAFLRELKDQITLAEVIGLGSSAFNFWPVPGTLDLFDPQLLESHLFSNMKYYFSFATYGRISGKELRSMATVLQKKNPRAVFLGSSEVEAPFTFPLFLPRLGSRDRWDIKDIEKIDQFGKSIIERLNGTAATPYPSFEPLESLGRPEQLKVAKTSGPLIVDIESCVKCGRCESVCPYNAITLDADKNDGFPVVDTSKCWACATCFNHCPSTALQFPRWKTHLRERQSMPLFEQSGPVKGTAKVMAGSRSIIVKTHPPRGTPRMLTRLCIGRRFAQTLAIVPMLLLVVVITTPMLKF